MAEHPDSDTAAPTNAIARTARRICEKSAPKELLKAANPILELRHLDRVREAHMRACAMPSEVDPRRNGDPRAFEHFPAKRMTVARKGADVGVNEEPPSGRHRNAEPQRAQ